MPGDEEPKPGQDEGATSYASFPGPKFPPKPGNRLVYWSTETDDTPGGREFEDIMLRRVPGAVAHRFRGAAGARGFTHAQYLTALVTLHEAMRERADRGDEEVAATLEQLGLGTVSI
jgi:hypothetical protein